MKSENQKINSKLRHLNTQGSRAISSMWFLLMRDLRIILDHRPGISPSLIKGISSSPDLALCRVSTFLIVKDSITATDHTAPADTLGDRQKI